MAREEHEEEVLPLLKVAEDLHIKRRTLYGWLHDAGITPRQADGKNKGISRAEYNQLAYLHGRMPHAAISAADWAALLQRVATLEERVAQLSKEKSGDG